MRSTYKEEDVTILLKDVTGQIAPLPLDVREKRIQSGISYASMLPVEYEPGAEYLRIFHGALEAQAPEVAQAVAGACNLILDAHQHPVLVSLARAGISAGILFRRYIRNTWNLDIPHYAISIVRGRGIDHNAIRHILNRHASQDICFVDAWTGKGAIARELRNAMQDCPQVDPGLAVIADPGHCAKIAGTRDDLMIPSSCLNATVSGLLSRTVLRVDLIGPDDFHGAVFYEELAESDLTYEYIDAVCACFKDTVPQDTVPEAPDDSPLREVRRIASTFGVRDIGLVKPGIGEATRVLLRRMPWKILVHSLKDTVHLGHLYRLAKEKGVPVEEYPLQNYRACGIIRCQADA